MQLLLNNSELKTKSTFTNNDIITSEESFKKPNTDDLINLKQKNIWDQLHSKKL